MKIAHEQYLGKAAEYHDFRPKYSDNLTIMLHDKLSSYTNLIGVDIGAGTGIWTRQLLNTLPWERLIALEPNHELLLHGKAENQDSALIWTEGIAEQLPLESNSADLITFASTFNWVDKEQALLEALRVLKKDGLICLVWNPIAKNETRELQETEEFLNLLTTSQQSTNTKKKALSKQIPQLLQNAGFSAVEYHEFKDSYPISLASMKHFWTYTDKIKHQLSEEQYQMFLEFLNKQFNANHIIHYTCMTRCWLAKK